MNSARRSVWRWMTLVLIAGGWLGDAQTVSADNTPFDLSVMRRTEREVDSRIERFDTEAPLYVIGATRGLYLAGTGAVYSVEVSLAPAVGITPFFQKPSDAQINKIHKAKTERVPVLRDLMLSMMPELAVSLRGLPDGEEVVMAITLFYFRYEKLDGLPRQMVVRGNAGALRKLHAAQQTTGAAEVSKVSRVVTY